MLWVFLFDWLWFLFGFVFVFFNSTVIAYCLFKVPNQNICLSKEQAHKCLDGMLGNGQWWQGPVSLGAGSSWGAGGCCWGGHLPSGPHDLAGSPMVNPDGLQPHLSIASPSLLLFCSSARWRVCGKCPVKGDREVV